MFDTELNPTIILKSTQAPSIPFQVVLLPGKEYGSQNKYADEDFHAMPSAFYITV